MARRTEWQSSGFHFFYSRATPLLSQTRCGFEEPPSAFFPSKRPSTSVVRLAFPLPHVYRSIDDEQNLWISQCRMYERIFICLHDSFYVRVRASFSVHPRICPTLCPVCMLMCVCVYDPVSYMCWCARHGRAPKLKLRLGAMADGERLSKS